MGKRGVNSQGKTSHATTWYHIARAVLQVPASSELVSALRFAIGHGSREIQKPSDRLCPDRRPSQRRPAGGPGTSIVGGDITTVRGFSNMPVCSPLAGVRTGCRAVRRPLPPSNRHIGGGVPRVLPELERCQTRRRMPGDAAEKSKFNPQSSGRDTSPSSLDCDRQRPDSLRQSGREFSWVDFRALPRSFLPLAPSPSHLRIRVGLRWGVSDRGRRHERL
jgi:hypothetical protein